MINSEFELTYNNEEWLNRYTFSGAVGEDGVFSYYDWSYVKGDWTFTGKVSDLKSVFLALQDYDRACFEKSEVMYQTTDANWLCYGLTKEDPDEPEIDKNTRKKLRKLAYMRELKQRARYEMYNNLKKLLFFEYEQ